MGGGGEPLREWEGRGSVRGAGRENRSGSRGNRVLLACIHLGCL